MAAPKKKTTSKKSSTGSKKTTTKSASKNSKKSAKKITTTVPVIPIKNSTSIKTKKTPPHFTKELLPEESASPKNARMDTSFFTTILAIFVVILVVLGGYIYSRQSRMMEPPAPPTPVANEPQRINISSSVELTPDVIAALEYIVTQITVGPGEVLQKVRTISDASSARGESDFFVDVQSGDMVFHFTSAAILYRPSTKKIIKTGMLPPTT